MITSIPELIAKYGNMANACRETGLSEVTLAKYRYDVDCKHHVIYNNRLMSHQINSPELYSRRGVSRADRRDY